MSVQHNFANLTLERGVISRAGTFGSIEVDLEETIYPFNFIKDENEHGSTLRIVPSEHFENEFFTAEVVSDEPIVWVLVDEFALIQRHATTMQVLQVGKYMLIGLIKGRLVVLDENSEEVYEFTRNYTGDAKEPEWMRASEFQATKLSDRHKTRDFHEDRVKSDDRFLHGIFKYGVARDFQIKADLENSPLLDNGFWAGLDQAREDAIAQAAAERAAKREAEEEARLTRDKEDLDNHFARQAAEREGVAEKKANTETVKKATVMTGNAFMDALRANAAARASA